MRPTTDGVVSQADRGPNGRKWELPGSRTELRPEDPPTPPAGPDDFPDDTPKKRM